MKGVNFEKYHRLHEQFIKSHVNRYLLKSNSIYDHDDLIQEALIVLLKCSINFNNLPEEVFEKIFRKSFRNRMLDIVRKAKRTVPIANLEFMKTWVEDRLDWGQRYNNIGVNHLLEMLPNDFHGRMFISLHAIGCTRKEVKSMLSIGDSQYYTIRNKIFDLVK